MPPPVPEQLSRTIETLYRSESGRVLATLVRLLGDLDLAEESMHEAFAAALESWTLAGIPDKPRPWLISTARFKAIDAMRRRARFDGAQKDLVAHIESLSASEEIGDEEIEDDRLRLIFTCCHPALPPEGQVALTLREICGLTTEEIARAFLVTPATLAQRIVRAKAVIRDKAIPYQVPVSQELSARLGAVLLVVYLIFNEGFTVEKTSAELSREAIRLGRLLLGRRARYARFSDRTSHRISVYRACRRRAKTHIQGDRMRKIRIIEHISLDGVIQGPGGPKEDDYRYGGWAAPHDGPEGGAAIMAAHAEPFDLLLGRRTYDIWSGFWPKAPKSPMADSLNGATKYVATHRPDSLEWGPFEGLGPDIVDGVRRIKAMDGPGLILWGSSTLTSKLLEHGLAGEVLLVVSPIPLGTRERFFLGG